MDDKKFIDNYFAITEHFQEFLISIKKNYQTIDHICNQSHQKNYKSNNPTKCAFDKYERDGPRNNEGLG